MIKGKVHSFQSLGAVDGPGIRFIVFMQGCPYTCPYCHNPDTKSFTGGTEYTADEIVKKALRYRTYFGNDGGVTVSGGEPLMQSEFVAELFEKLHENGISTALDTAGVKPTALTEKVLLHTDTVLCDIKHHSEDGYKKYFSSSLSQTLEFLALCDKMDKNIVIRHVVVPQFTDTEEGIREIGRIANGLKNLKKIELLPFHKMCTEKYEKLGIPFPLADTPECDKETLERVKSYLK